jgi:enamine deaminase RidA (YjgF/YER057c/UK114 family)
VEKFMQGFAPIMQHMKGHRPASTLLGVQRLASPELMIEIEATAVA